MFCTKCGAEIREGEFCPSCGTKIQDSNAIWKKDVLNQGKEKTNKKLDIVNLARLKISKKNLLCFALGAIIVIVIISCVLNHKTTIDLNKYVDVEFEGYDTVGHASVNFDYEAFENDYAEKIKFNEKRLDEYLEKEEVEMSRKEFNKAIKSGDAYEILFDSYIDGELDNDNNLKNNDIINFIWNCDDEMASKYFKCKLKYSDIEFAVNGLEEVGVIDPFEAVQIEYKGICPDVCVFVQGDFDREINEDIHYSVTPQTDVKNGDDIIITAELVIPEEAFIERYGKRLTLNEKTIIAEGLNSYAFEEKEIVDIGSMQKIADKKIKELVEGEIEDSKNIKGIINSIEQVDNYFWVSEGDDEQAKNCYYFIYKIDMTETLTLKDGTEESHPFTYYSYVGFADVIIDSDGKVIDDMLEEWIVTSDEVFSYDTGRTQGIFKFPVIFEFTGMESLDVLQNECMTKSVRATNKNSDYEDNLYRLGMEEDLSEKPAPEAEAEAIEVKPEGQTDEIE